MKRRQYTYEQLRKVAKVIYKDKGFCTVIATAIACKVSYGRAYGELAFHERKHGKGSVANQYEYAIEGLGCTIKEVYCFYKNFKETKPQSFSKIIKTLSRDKIYLITTKRHVTCMINGKIEDWMDSRRKHGVYSIKEVIRDF